MAQSHSVAPARRLPEKPNLNQLKKQAKDLLDAFERGDPTARTEVRAHYPEFAAGAATRPLRLSDAQLVLARAYGFTSWPKLKAYVDGVTINRFVAAVEAGAADQVEAMLGQRPELVHTDTSENNEMRGLHYAVMRRDLQMVRLLMQAGSDARKGVYPHRDATTAFALARDRGYSEIVEAIEREEQRRRERASCPNTSVSPVQDRINAAIRNGDLPAAMHFLEADTGLIHACDRDGATPLHVAAQALDALMVEWLLKQGAKPNKRDLRGLAPLDRAAMAVDPRNDSAQKFPAVARFLLDRGAEVNLHAAVALGDARRIRELVATRHGVLREGHWWKGGLVSLAVKHGRTDMVRLLLDLGADVDERIMLEELEEPALSWGAPLWYAALAGRRDIAELLLDRGADPNGNVYASGWPLSRAYERKDEAMKRLLLARGAKLQPHIVAQAHDVASARQMLDASPEERVVEELAWAAAEAGCVEILQLALPRLDWPRNNPRWHWFLIQPVRGLGDNFGLPKPITLEQRLQCMEILLAHGIDVNVAARGGIENEEERTSFAALLLDRGARLDLRDDLLKSTPLGWACRWGRKELVELFVERGASVDEPDAEPWARPQAWANKMGHTEVQRRLRN